MVEAGSLHLPDNSLIQQEEYMNKKLLTLAVAGALVGGVGAAQADVTVYGKAHVSIDRENTTNTVDNTVVSNNSSRLGFKFSEDLGGGMNAIGQYEVGYNGIEGEGTIFSARNSFVGLSSNTLGTVLAGRRDTPFKDLRSAVELFPEQIGDARNLTARGGEIGWDLRLNNVVAYATPTWAGVSAMVAWSSDASAVVNTNTDNNEASAASASITYKGGPLYVAAAYEKHDSNVVGTGGQEDETGLRIAASGTFGMFKVIALYQQVADLAGVSGADQSVYGLGGSVTLAEKHVIKAQFYNADPVDTAATDNGAQMFAVGYDYKFSKKTTGYVAYAKTSNDAAGSYLVSDNGTNRSGHGESLVVAAGNDIQAASIGVIMDF